MWTMSAFARLTFVLICGLSNVLASESEFNNDLNVRSKENGDSLQLRSQGTLSKIIDFDAEAAVKRVLCAGNMILVALNSDVPEVDWEAGKIVVGSDKWNCFMNKLKPESKTIYAQISRVSFPKDGRVDLEVSQAGPLDMLEEAKIEMHYQQNSAEHARSKRYLSNPLQKTLQDINWVVNDNNTDIPFNEDVDGRVLRLIQLVKTAVNQDPEIYLGKGMSEKNGSTQLKFLCHSCHGKHKISYHFELHIKKINNTARVQKYLSQVELDSTISHNLSVSTEEELTLSESRELWRTEPVQLLQVPVAVFKTLPPILLTVRYSSHTHLDMMYLTKGTSRYRGTFDGRGYVVFTQRYEKGHSPTNDISVYNWTVNGHDQILDANCTVNGSLAVYQDIKFMPSISWAQKDIDMELGPPFRISIKPTVNVLSESTGVARCFTGNVTVDGNFSVSETGLNVKAFGINIWNVPLMPGRELHSKVIRRELFNQCRADCHGPLSKKLDVTMEQACGKAIGAIRRGYANFSMLHQLWGNFILFSSEEANTSVWCGHPGRACISCVTDVVGYDENTKCADRMMTTDLAAAVTHLGKYVKAEWPDRKVLVIEGWDEPTSSHPEGKHGNTSLFYEGKAVELAITKPFLSMTGTTDWETNTYILSRFSELAVCSGFHQVANISKDSSIEACVGQSSVLPVKRRSIREKRSKAVDIVHSEVSQILTEVGNRLKSKMGTITFPKKIDVGNSYPPNLQMNSACGEPTIPVTRENTVQFKRLVQYQFDDVKFDPEGPLDAWCGTETRKCINCSTYRNTSDPWDWCSTRTMPIRLAVRLKRLAVLTGGKVKVERLLSDRVTVGMSQLYLEGRAATISSVDFTNLSAAAVLAGFDFVKQIRKNQIEVCVKLQDGLHAEIAQFALINLVAAPIPTTEEEEYDYPNEYVKESRKPLLFDSTVSPSKLSEHFQISQFRCPGKRYFRLDPILVDILELVRDDFGEDFIIVTGSAYRVRSINRENIESRHAKEIYRFQMGQAVEVRPKGLFSDVKLLKFGLSLVKSSSHLRVQALAFGIGCKKDRFYFHLHPETDNIGDQPIDIWDSGNTNMYHTLDALRNGLLKGGSMIAPRFLSVACNTPVLGEKHFYLTFDLEENGTCWTAHDSFCSETQSRRQDAAEVFQKSLSRAAGAIKLPRQDILPEVEECVVKLCGGCPSAGEIWNKKVTACTRMLIKYLDRASMPFQPLQNNVAFFNTENTESSVHSLACHDDSICVENTQIYSLMLPLITATYRTENTDEMLFGSSDNPTPLLEIVEQELAWRAQGVVNVYVDNEKDIVALRNVLKILLTMNKNVTEVIFNLDPDVKVDDVMATVQRKVEVWSGKVCPLWGRLVVTPYKIHEISPTRKRRSVERSTGRNIEKDMQKNWEVNWLLNS